MRVLLVDVPDVLRGPLRAALAHRHEVVELRGDVRDLATCRAYAGCDAVVHGSPDDDTDPSARVERATLGTWNLLTSTTAGRYVRLSTMRLLDAYDSRWAVTERWAPRPTAEPRDLAAHLGELTSRELVRSRPVEAHVLRLDDVVAAAGPASGPGAETWVHVDDAVRAVVGTVERERSASGPRWQVRHVVRGDGRYPLAAAGDPPLDPEPAHARPADGTATAPPAWPAPAGPLTDLRRPGRVTLLGGGGPLGVATFAALSGDHRVRVTDARPLAELAGRAPQSPGAPVAAPVPPPHEEAVVDVCDADAVMAAAAGADCLVNCTVVRGDPVGAFRVNVLGALHTMQAAVATGIGRVVHTGPTLVLPPYPYGYLEDRGVDEAAPPRAGDDLYFLTKLLGQELCRVVAEQHGIACPVLLFCGFVEPSVRRSEPVHPFSVSWADAGRAMAAAVHVSRLPEPSPVLHVLAPSPHGSYRDDRVREVLGWEATDRLDAYWYRS